MYQLKLGGVYMEITSFCNRDCPYCYNDSTREGKVLNKEIIFRILEECSNYGISSISISGGEPFTHPAIYEILSKLDELHMKAVIITNLSLLPIERAVEIADLLNIPGAVRMEAYDISNISGFQSVGSMVVFEKGKPKKFPF